MLRLFFKTLNVLALLVLLLSCMAAYIKPTQYWQLSFIGFAFPIVLIVNVFFLLLWILKRDAFGLISLVAIALTWNFIQESFALNFNTEYKEQGIKLMTWNVKNFDLYNWSHNKKTHAEMMQLIKAENPDIICFQEFYSDNGILFNNIKYLSDTLGYSSYYFQPTTRIVKPYKRKPWKSKRLTDTIDQQWGVAIVSKYKFTDTGRIDFSNSKNNDCIYVDIELNKKPLRLYSVHFQSIHLGDNDYATLDSIQGNQKANWLSVKSILRKMKRAFTKRSEQAAAVAEHMSSFSGRKILCGDFNDVPVSYTYNTVNDNLTDAFVKKGKGFGATFANKFSVFRIDYALFSEDIQINSYRTIHKELSDHYPVIVTFNP